MAKVKINPCNLPGKKLAMVEMTGAEMTEKVGQMYDLLREITKEPLEGFAVVHALHEEMKKMVGMVGEVTQHESEHPFQ